jgi:hypothetical protein
MKYLLLLASLLATFSASYADSQVEILIKSNVAAEFYIDGEKIGIGKSVYQKLNSNDEYELIAAPQGYQSKEYFLEPPHMDGATVDFFFLMEDKINEK